MSCESVERRSVDAVVVVVDDDAVGVDADLEDGIIIDTITDGGNQGGRITSYVNQPSVGNKLNIFHNSSVFYYM